MGRIFIAFTFSCVTLLSSQPSQAHKKIVLTPYQSNLKSCLDIDKNLDVKKINNNKKLYKYIEQFYALVTSETLYREVLYTQKRELKKLKFADGVIQIFKVLDEDDSISLLSSEKFGDKKEDYQVRHKIRSSEGRINQLLVRADIQSDFQKIKETRAKDMLLNIVWADKEIQSLNIEFLAEKKALSCIQKELIDICNCQSR
ncbi:MAG: hypothetical protein AABY53_10205 [Bdellovibrionota bacterium]